MVREIASLASHLQYSFPFRLDDDLAFQPTLLE